MVSLLTSLVDGVVHSAFQRPRTSRELAGTAVPIAGRTVLITGASSGIGAEAARLFVREGATVIIVARRTDELDAVAASINAELAEPRAHVKTVDMSDTDDVARCAAAVIAEHGCPDVVINNAGRSIRRSVLDSTDRLHDYERTMAVNYFGPVALTLALIPAMRERGSGHFINVSTWGIPIGAVPKFSAYAGSKAALTCFGRSIALDLAGTGIDVTTVYFPLVRTPMIAPTEEFSTAPALAPEEAARWLLHAARYRESEVMPRVSRFIRRLGSINTSMSDGLIRFVS